MLYHRTQDASSPQSLPVVEQSSATRCAAALKQPILLMIVKIISISSFTDVLQTAAFKLTRIYQSNSFKSSRRKWIVMVRCFSQQPCSSMRQRMEATCKPKSSFTSVLCIPSGFPGQSQPKLTPQESKQMSLRTRLTRPKHD